MGCYVTAKQFAVEPIQVSDELVKIVPAAINSQVNASMTQLWMVVDQEGLLVVTLDEVYGNVDRESGSSYTALGPEEGEHRSARSVASRFGIPLLV